MNVLLNVPENTGIITVTVIMGNGLETHVQVSAFEPKKIAEVDFEWKKDAVEIERKEE